MPILETEVQEDKILCKECSLLDDKLSIRIITEPKIILDLDLVKLTERETKDNLHLGLLGFKEKTVKMLHRILQIIQIYKILLTAFLYHLD
jgi:hypothetical protein